MATSPLQFYRKVVVVTGAGGGLGRQYALQFAKRGAALVVNDLGGTRDGEGQDQKVADAVVEEIQIAGGTAVADYNSVEHGEKIVQTAVDKYGKVDIVINNAGIVRDRSFVKMSTSDWDLVQSVHLRGSFMVSKAAWPYMRKQNYGKLIFTASAVAMFGNFGQANYGAAKMGLVGLCKTLAIEGSKYNISCNTIIPTAVSRMTEGLLPDDVKQAFDPKYVAPLVMWLSHQSCQENGGVFEAGGGWIGKYEIRRSKGINCLQNDEVTPEAISHNWSDVGDMNQATVLDGIHAQISSIVNSVPKSNTLTRTISYTQDDIILYALGVGCSVEQTSYLKFVYEKHENFSAIPSFGVLPAINFITNDMDHLNAMIAARLPNFKTDASKLLHGEHYLELPKPLDVSRMNNLTSRLELVDILDKTSGAVLVLNISTKDENNEDIFFNQLNVFVKGAGGFGGKRSSDKIYSIMNHPDRPPDAEVTQRTSGSQAALYRLTGDKNPLHIDPEVAEVGGFSKPLLHGLCSLGFATRHVMSKFADDDSSMFKRIKVRFSNPVMPGETIRTKMWKEGQRIHFEAEIVETGKTVISGAYIDLLGSDKHSNDGL